MTKQIETIQARLAVNDFIARFEQSPMDSDAFELVTDLFELHFPEFSESEVRHMILHGGEL